MHVRMYTFTSAIRKESDVSRQSTFFHAWHRKNSRYCVKMRLFSLCACFVKRGNARKSVLCKTWYCARIRAFVKRDNARKSVLKGVFLHVFRQHYCLPPMWRCTSGNLRGTALFDPFSRVFARLSVLSYVFKIRETRAQEVCIEIICLFFRLTDSNTRVFANLHGKSRFLRWSGSFCSVLCVFLY